MAPSRDRSILGITSIISLVIATYLLFKLPHQVPAASPFHLNLCITTISSFNLTILFAWFAFGAYGAISLTVLVILFTLWIILKESLHPYYLLIPPFFLTAILGYGYSRIKVMMRREAILKLEKMDEEINLLSNDVRGRKSGIKSLEGKFKRYSILKDIVEAFSTVLSLDAVNKLIIEKASEIIAKGGRLLLFLVDAERQELMLSASSIAEGEMRVKMKTGDVFDRWVLRHRTPLIVEDVERDFRFPTDEIEKAKGYFASLIATPLVSENKVIGILRMDSPSESIYAQDDLRLLDIISDLGAVAIQNSLLYAKTQELAIRDGLTGLFLRRYFMERFGEEIKRTARKKGELSLLMVDIDHFKEYNDRYGHTAGDLVLKHLGRTVSLAMREGDIVARYGGEEVAILLLGTDRAAAEKKAETLRKGIENNPLVLRREKTIVTVSIGISSYPEDAALEEELIKIADERLYKAKVEGRNRVCAVS